MGSVRPIGRIHSNSQKEQNEQNEQNKQSQQRVESTKTRGIASYKDDRELCKLGVFVDQY
jgi:hypothetical protein